VTNGESAVNRQIIRDAFDAWREGTAPITEVFADEMVWRFEGHSLASREYKNPAEFINQVLVPFGARFTDSEPFRPTRIRSVHADDDTVIVVWDGRGVATDGLPYENSYAWFMKLRDGKVVDGTGGEQCRRSPRSGVSGRKCEADRRGLSATARIRRRRYEAKSALRSSDGQSSPATHRGQGVDALRGHRSQR
jgi:hypothetical protein